MKKTARFLGLGLAATVFMLAPVVKAHASTVTITYYTIAETDRDANNLGSGTFNNEVQSQLGPNGLPVLNTSAFGCTSDCYPTNGPADVLADGQITYWSPSLNNGGPAGASDVTFTSSASVTLPFNNTSFFPPNGTGSSDFNGFQAATLSATLNAPSTELISFSIGADDMAFAYLDGTNVCDLGGVHGDSVGSCVTPFDITAGNHSLQVFFVDINNTQSALHFDVTTQGVTTNSAPEPASLGLLGIGLCGLAALRRRAGRVV